MRIRIQAIPPELIAAAAEAEEVFDVDELERYADESRAKRDRFIAAAGLEAALPIIERQEPDLFRGHPPLGWLATSQIRPQDLVPKLRFQTGMLLRRYQRRLYRGQPAKSRHC